MASVFDGMPDIFVGSFGEDIIYTPSSGSPRTIRAIWIEVPDMQPVLMSDSDITISRLHVRASDIAEPLEGDTALRVRTGKLCKVVPPIRPDDKGMIACALEATT